MTARPFPRIGPVAGVPAALVLALGLAPATPSVAQVAVRAATLHTAAGVAISDGVVLIAANGKIEKVGPATSVPGARRATGCSARPLRPPAWWTRTPSWGSPAR